MSESLYFVGIDLGTTNSSLAYFDTRHPRGKPSIFSVPQLVKPNQIEKLKILPSFLYLPAEFEFSANSLEMPWPYSPIHQGIVGQMAKTHGQKVPQRLVHSAKSWLCHSAVDRHASILPWGSPIEVTKISPVEASRRYLEHLKKAWNSTKAKSELEYLEHQNIVLTVPASFDEVARELTLEAAQQAGLKKVILLEEPMAAFYYWISNYETNWPKKLQGSQLALVCDVGGGTTDFSLIEVISEKGHFQFKRLAVGDHLMLGGNNMDLALAVYLEQTQAKKKLDPVELTELASLCAEAKETLWQAPETDKFSFSLLRRGSSVIANTLKFQLSCSDLHQILLEGFFPLLPWEESLGKPVSSGLKELGLPYVSDPAITRHLLKFLKKQLPPERPKIDLVLFNGGALIPQAIRDRLLQQISQWFSSPEKQWLPMVLHNKNLHLAVTYGAAYFNQVRSSGRGIRIEGGTPRSYFLEVQSATSANVDPKIGTKKAICLLPFGTQEGQSCQITQHTFEVLARQPVAFPLYSSTVRKQDRAGDLVEIQEEEMLALPLVQTVLQVGRKAKNQQIPVCIEANLTEIGTLELWLTATDSDRRWKLQFSTSTDAPPLAVSSPLPEETIPFPRQEVLTLLRQTFHERVPKEFGPNLLTSHLEQTLQLSRESWDLQMSRKLWDLLFEMADQRHLSPEHETRWLNLIGYCLRPGRGVIGDEQRFKKLWPILKEGVTFDRHTQSWVEWWILWRRISAGMNGNQQLEIFYKMPLLPSTAAKKNMKRHLSPQEQIETWRAAASFEYLPITTRLELGDLLIKKIVSSSENKNFEFWALGRIGARTPLYARKNAVLPPEKIKHWIQQLLALEDPRAEKFYTLAELCKRSGDRVIDIEEMLRQEVTQHLHAHPEISGMLSLCQMVEEVVELNASLQKHYFGDSLPPGLILVASSS